MDLNCDLGESFGAYSIGSDEAMMPLITSANIACGLHAGDPVVMQRTVQLAAQQGVRIGAHPGYPDLQGFGRRNLDLTLEEAAAFTLYQLGALAAFARLVGAELTHVKPHGALYNQAARDASLAAVIARATAKCSRSLVLVGLAGSRLLSAGLDAGLRVAGEGFPDRAYEPDGSLRSRRLPGALLEDPADIAAQAIRLAREGVRVETGGEPRFWMVETLCLHGDHPRAVENARVVRAALKQAGVLIQPLS